MNIQTLTAFVHQLTGSGIPEKDIELDSKSVTLNLDELVVNVVNPEKNTILYCFKFLDDKPTATLKPEVAATKGIAPQNGEQPDEQGTSDFDLSSMPDEIDLKSLSLKGLSAKTNHRNASKKTTFGAIFRAGIKQYVRKRKRRAPLLTYYVEAKHSDTDANDQTGECYTFLLYPYRDNKTLNMDRHPPASIADLPPIHVLQNTSNIDDSEIKKAGSRGRAFRLRVINLAIVVLMIVLGVLNVSKVLELSTTGYAIVAVIVILLLFPYTKAVKLFGVEIQWDDIGDAEADDDADNLLLMNLLVRAYQKYRKTKQSGDGDKAPPPCAQDEENR